MSDKLPPKSKYRQANSARPISDLLGKVMEPVMSRRSGMSVDLLNAWDEIVGEEFSKSTKPERIKWPLRAHEDDPFEPATLVVACDNASALFFQHEQSVILERINLFFGFEAVKRIKIEQKPVFQTQKNTPQSQKSLSASDEAELIERVENIDNQTLKKTLIKLGRGVIGQSRS